MATEEEKANITKRRGALAAGIEDMEAKKKFIARSADVDKDFEKVSNETAGEGEKQSRESNIKQAREVLGNYKKGGKIDKTGAYELHKDETVLPADDEKKAEKLAIKHLGKKAGPMSAAMEEEGEPAEEEKGESKKEENAEGKDGKRKTSDKHNPAHESKGKKGHATVIHHHKSGHSMHHMMEDGSVQTHQFALGDHAAMGKNIGDMLQASGQGAAPAEEMGSEPEGGSPAAQ